MKISEQSVPLNRANLEEAVFSFEEILRLLKTEKKSLQEAEKNTCICLEFLGGILKTHTNEDLPRHDSGESLFFFKDEMNESALVSELCPPATLMPKMKRISIKDAKTKDMICGGRGYIIQRVYLSGEKGGHELIVVCFVRKKFEILYS